MSIGRVIWKYYCSQTSSVECPLPSFLSIFKSLLPLPSTRRNATHISNKSRHASVHALVIVTISHITSCSRLEDSSAAHMLVEATVTRHRCHGHSTTPTGDKRVAGGWNCSSSTAARRKVDCNSFGYTAPHRAQVACGRVSNPFLVLRELAFNEIMDD